MSEFIYDLAVIGGGINGAGIARDAAGRGAKVILLERGDLARGTSSASTKLIHGGLRYLEHYEFKLVRESLMERERLWKIAPHIIWPMRFVLPHQKGIRPAWLVRLGLFLYDHIGGRKLLPATRTLNLRNDPAGKPLLPHFAKAFEYSDCWVDDARLVALNARDAADRGAEILTRTEVTRLERQGGIWHIAATGHATIKARAIANAAGPAVLDLLGRTVGHTGDSDERIRLVRGSHIVVRSMFDSPQAYFCQNPDGRIFFAIPYEDDYTLIGTTDADHHGPLDNVTATEEEIAYLCDSAGAYFTQRLTPVDVIYSYAGVRPLVDDGSGKPETASRGYHFDIDTDKNGTVPILAGASWTDEKALPGGDFPMTGASALAAEIAQKYAFLPDALIKRIVRSYGTRAYEWLATATSLADLGEDFGYGLYAAEVDYLMAKEWARSAEDILWRRSKLGLRFNNAEVKVLETYVSAKAQNESV